MTTIDLTIPESEAKRFLEQMKDRVESMEEVLETFEENGLKDTDPYWELDAMKCDKKEGVRQIERQIEEQTEENEKRP